MKNDKKSRIEQKVNKIIDLMPSITDPNGSYTGRPLEGENTVPVQDSDDL